MTLEWVPCDDDESGSQLPPGIGSIGECKEQQRKPSYAENQLQEVTIYRELAGDLSKDKTYFKNPKLNPSQFQYRGGGISAFEFDYLSGVQPYAIGFDVEIIVTEAEGTAGQEGESPHGNLKNPPGCTAVYTPELEGHWNIDCNDPPNSLILSAYAKTAIGYSRVILNPKWTGLPLDRRIPPYNPEWNK